jgi:ATP-dependent DNA helicase RecG
MTSLKTNIRSLGGVYKRYSSYLEKLGIINLEDFLFHIPNRYDDYSIISQISDLQPGETVTIQGKIMSIKNQYTRRHFTIQKAIVSDDTSELEIVWFNQPFIPKSISKGDLVSISGKVEYKAGKLQMTSPDYEILNGESIHTGRLVPIYPETRGVSSKWIRRQVHKLINENINELEEYLPEEIISNNKLEKLIDAIRKVHFPNSLEEVSVAKHRLSFDELFIIQASGAIIKLEVEGYREQVNKLIESLPFDLTGAQRRTIEQIFSDMSSEKPMNRLVEGDVGSGKTVVAAISAYLTHLNGHQTVIMAPTEILAGQHYKTLTTFLEPFNLKIAFATGSKKTSLDTFDVLVGTHAVISEKIKFENLGLVVIDEQQRFGVKQRSIIRQKGLNPHVLTMTATPIPRTIALTMYGELDLSILDEMPKGRKIIKTWLVPKLKREAAYEWIKKQIDENGSQVFIVCPFIEESESMTTVKAAAKEFERLRKSVFTKHKLGLLHGKIKAKEKDKILADFKNKKFDILVATPVVEVGIDIPNADIILIEAAERFGLSQLHQLRGRVGRNDRQAYCLLFTESDKEETNQRLKAMEKTNVGAELAELDLIMRGPGEIYGTQQHGRRFLKIASFSDFELIKQTKTEADRILNDLENHPKLKEKIEEITVKEVSPD